MKRHSIKKASTFKLQGERSKFQSYLEDIQNCPMIQKQPHLSQMIKQTSETVFSYCYTFREHSPFNKGLNYGSRSIGFRFEDNVLYYKEWLPNIDSAYIMGEFNQFNTTSHKLQRSEQDGPNWYQIQIDLTGSHIQDDGSKVMLCVINHQGTEFYMIPPSCHIIANGYGIIKKSQILPISKKKLKINQLLAYTIDLSNVSLSQCLEFLQKEQQLLEFYNTIILKNFFKNNYGLMYRHTIEFSQLEKLREIIRRIKNDCGCKAVIEWNLESGKMQYLSNPIEEKFLKQGKQGAFSFDFENPQVMAYYLANTSFFYQNLGIDGIHFTNIEHALTTREGTIILKCLNILNTRIIESGITLGSSREYIQALDGQIIEGGCGFSFTYNHHQSLSLNNTHQQLYQVFQKIKQHSNCLAINFNELDQSHGLNLILVIMLSNKGIFTGGNFSNIKPQLKKILKLRCQDKLFDNELQSIKFLENDNVVMIQRGVSVILLNFSEEQLWIDVDKSNQMEIIFTQNADDTEINNNKVKLPAKSCVLLQNQCN